MKRQVLGCLVVLLLLLNSCMHTAPYVVDDRFCRNNGFDQGGVQPVFMHKFVKCCNEVIVNISGQEELGLDCKVIPRVEV